MASWHFSPAPHFYFCGLNLRLRHPALLLPERSGTLNPAIPLVVAPKIFPSCHISLVLETFTFLYGLFLETTSELSNFFATSEKSIGLPEQQRSRIGMVWKEIGQNFDSKNRNSEVVCQISEVDMCNKAKNDGVGPSFFLVTTFKMSIDFPHLALWGLFRFRVG